MLIAREYGGKTQLFLETLPVRRSTVLWTKLLLGLTLQLAIVIPAIAGCAALAWRRWSVRAARGWRDREHTGGPARLGAHSFT